MRSREERAALKQLLRLLLEERSDSDGLCYLPSGTEGMRRMIKRLLLLRPDVKPEDEISELLLRLRELGCPLEDSEP